LIFSDLGPEQLRNRLGEGGLLLHIDPLVVRVQSSIPAVVSALAFQYACHEVLEGRESFADFHIGIESPRGVRRWLKPQVAFSFDGEYPFKPLPVSQAYPVFEWGLNWCIANHYHRFVMVHAAVLERDGLAVVMPGEPGAGKSTLSAALASRGWRLFSDEMALLEPESNRLTPIPRPVCLKNESIDVIRRFAPDAAIGEAFRDTRKGDVAHMRAPEDAVRRATESAAARWVIFPRYCAGADLEVTPVSKPQAVLRLADQCFNYSQLGAEAFHTLCSVVDASDCSSLSYSRLSDAIEFFDQLSSRTGG
jgi:HprK-related kinase A